MLISVIVPSFNLEKYHDLIEAISSLLTQSYPGIEVVAVIHTDKRLYDKMVELYASNTRVKLIFREESLGLSAARNIGLKAATGDILAFMDDDAVADKDWIVNLVETYQKFNALAVGGKILPIWLGGQPDYFPEELYWLAGATHKGFAPDEICEVRNAFGPNMSFKREVFEQIGLFNERLGFSKRGTSYLQAEEAEFSLRMTCKLGARVVYNPRAVVYHKIPRSKARIGLMLKRSFYQGYSKALLARVNPASDPIMPEKSHLKDLLTRYMPERVKGVVIGPQRLSRFKQLLVLALCIVAVGTGFAWGRARLGSQIRSPEVPPAPPSTRLPGQIKVKVDGDHT